MQEPQEEPRSSEKTSQLTSEEDFLLTELKSKTLATPMLNTSELKPSHGDATKNASLLVLLLHNSSQLAMPVSAHKESMSDGTSEESIMVVRHYNDKRSLKLKIQVLNT